MNLLEMFEILLNILLIWIIYFKWAFNLKYFHRIFFLSEKYWFNLLCHFFIQPTHQKLLLYKKNLIFYSVLVWKINMVSNVNHRELYFLIQIYQLFYFHLYLIYCLIILVFIIFNHLYSSIFIFIIPIDKYYFDSSNLD
jgi:hypothetical protein